MHFMRRSLPDGADGNYFPDRFAGKPISAPPSATLAHSIRLPSHGFRLPLPFPSRQGPRPTGGVRTVPILTPQGPKPIGGVRTVPILTPKAPSDLVGVRTVPILTPLGRMLRPPQRSRTASVCPRTVSVSRCGAGGTGFCCFCYLFKYQFVLKLTGYQSAWLILE